jgi:carbonic anhydrase
MHAIHPAVDAVKDDNGDRTSHNKAFVKLVTQANVRHAVAEIRDKSAILAELEKAGKLKIAGAMHDISTGRVTLLD